MSEVQPYEMNEEEFAEWYFENQKMGFEEYKSELREKIGGRTPHKIQVWIHATEEDRKLAEMIENLKRYDAITECERLRPEQLFYQQKGIVKKALEAGEEIPEKVLCRFAKKLGLQTSG